MKASHKFLLGKIQIASCFHRADKERGERGGFKLFRKRCLFRLSMALLKMMEDLK